MKKFLIIFLITKNFKKHPAKKISTIELFECHENDLNEKLNEFQRVLYQGMDIDTKFNTQITITSIVIV